MKNYFPEETTSAPAWMPVYISIMLVLLTVFIFLTTFIEADKAKARLFKEKFQQALLTKKGAGTLSADRMPSGKNPVNVLINRMKSEGINKKLMDEFLTLTEIKDLVVVDGQRGVSVTMPEAAGFEAGKNILTAKGMEYLDSITYLVSELPYMVEVKGYSSGVIPPGYTDALEFSARRAYMVYDYLVSKGISPLKLKLSGCGDAFRGTGVSQDKVEIIFKSPEL